MHAIVHIRNSMAGELGATVNGTITYTGEAASSLAYSESVLAGFLRANLEAKRIGVKSVSFKRTSPSEFRVTFRVVIDWACNDTDWIRNAVQSSVAAFGESVVVSEGGRTGCKGVASPPKPVPPPKASPGGTSIPPPTPDPKPDETPWMMYALGAVGLILIAKKR